MQLKVLSQIKKYIGEKEKDAIIQQFCSSKL